ncbi:MAG: patatin-like phospholipase family protein [Nostoc sp. ChiQUE01a]|nr:patatin-like phospholipase family protein [Nostoc sp. ChiQUE01a]
MKAYAILDGGGVKGAALVGCLEAARQNEIEFVGYGGTSAGSIVALLACMRIAPEEICKIMINVNFEDFLDNSQHSLNRLIKLPKKLLSSWSKINRLYIYYQHKDLFNTLNNNLGLCNADFLKQFLLNKIAEYLPKLRETIDFRKDVTFQDLQDQGCYPLKIVASDLKSRRCIVYPNEEDQGLGYSVIDAVRASMSYPFVFCPLKASNRLLVDGGLSSNLPIFLFEEERRRNRYAVIAFDLVVQDDANSSHNTNTYQTTENNCSNFQEFCSDLLATVLESSDDLLQRVINEIYCVRIGVSKDIHTLDFSISLRDRVSLRDAAYRIADQYIRGTFPHWRQVNNERERLEALYAPSRLVVPTLKTVAEEIESTASLETVRSYVMLTTETNKLTIVYQYGMNNDPDVDWELEIDAGCSGRVWSTHKPSYVKVEKVREKPSRYKMTEEQVNKIKIDRKFIFSVPIFDPWEPNSILTDKDFEALINSDFQQLNIFFKQRNIIGILSIDTSTPWQRMQESNIRSKVLRSTMVGSSILSKIFK